MLALLAILFTPQIKVDPMLLVEAQEVWSIIGKPNNPVWPGWDARKTPILIYFPGRQDLLINHPNPPRGFVPYHGPLSTKIGSMWVKDGPTLIDLDGQNTSLEVNGVETLVIADTLSTRRQWVEGLADEVHDNPRTADKIVEGSLFHDPYDQMVMFAHEAFHVYQRHMAPKKGGSEMSLTHYPSLSAENNTAIALEGEFLSAALTDKDPRPAALKWLALREWRRGLIGKVASDYEDGAEFSEGTAKYVEYRALQALEGRAPSHDIWLLQGFRGYDDLESERAKLIRSMRGFMDGTNGVNGDLYGASPVRFRLYFSGMGVGALLDRLGARWHDPILRTEASLTSLALEAIHASSSELSPALAEVQGSSRYASLLAEKRKLALDGAGYIRRELAKFGEAPAFVVLDYAKFHAKDVNLSFTPFGILNLGEDRALFRLVPVGAQIGSLSVSEDSARPVLRDDGAKTLTYQLIAPLDGSSLSGLVNLPEVRLPGVTLKNLRAVAEVKGQTLTLHCWP